MYGGHNNYKISDVPWDKVTHINYAFATIKIIKLLYLTNGLLQV
ncbi:hypothetical protein JTS99_18410 [Clostridium botulinum]|nr:hypothetical protein [Clostridium botulinum]